MDRITIPPAAIEAGAISLHFGGWGDADEADKTAYRETARAAFAAMVGAWPGAEHQIPNEWSNKEHLILPLTENPDAEA